MKVTVTVRENEWGGDSHIEIEVQTNTNKSSVSFGEGEPEDMTLSRDLSDAYSIEDLLKVAYEAGKRGESFEFEYLREGEED